MCLKTLKSSSGKARDGHMGQNEIFCEKIREFVHESRKCQTVYRNCEGYHERTVNYNDLTKLDDLVFLTLSDGKERASLTHNEFVETNKLAQFMAQKIYNSSLKFKCSEIRFQVVWIFYFDYLEREMKAMPVFKVYKKNTGSEAFYIDISVTEFESWDHLIMFCEFPASFICIPRRGEYTFRNIDGGDLLDLEYICKNSQLRDQFYRNFRPFSQTVMQHVLHRVVPFARVMISLLNGGIKFVEICGVRLHSGVALTMGIINILGICLRVLQLKYGQNVSQKTLESTASDCSLMLLNDNGEKSSPWKMCLVQLWDMIEHPPRDGFWTDIMKYMKNPQENFVEILKSVPEIIKVFKPLCGRDTGVDGAISTSPLDVPSVLLSINEENNIKRKKLNESKRESRNLEECSSEKVFFEVWQSAGNEIIKACVNLKELQENGLDLFGFRVFLLVKYTSAKCKRFLQNLLKSNYTLKEDTFFQNITHNGDLIGFVIPFSFLKENFALIVLHLDKLPEIHN